jgi:hypothetical protein
MIFKSVYSQKPLKGNSVSVNSNNINNVLASDSIFTSVTIPAILSSEEISNVVIRDSTIINTTIGISSESPAYFSSLNASANVLFAGMDPSQNVFWNSMTGQLSVTGSLKLTGCSYLDNIEICKNYIRADNLNGDITLSSNNLGTLFFQGGITHNASTGNYTSIVQNGSNTQISKNDITLTSSSGSIVTTSGKDTILNTLNGSIVLNTDTNNTTQNVTLIDNTNGNIRVNVLNNTLRLGDVISLSSPQFNGKYTISNILDSTHFLINVFSGTFVSSTGGTVQKIQNNDILLNASRNIVVPENIKLVFGNTQNSIVHNSTGLVLNSLDNFTFSSNTTNATINIPTSTFLQFGSISNIQQTSIGNLNINSLNDININSKNVTFLDPILTIAKGTTSNLDLRDRGIEYNWYDTTTQTTKLGWFGYKTSTKLLTFIPDATNTNEIITGSVGNFAINGLTATNFALASGGSLDINCGSIKNVKDIGSCSNNLHFSTNTINLDNNTKLNFDTIGSFITSNTNSNLVISSGNNVRFITSSFGSIVIPNQTKLSFDGTTSGNVNIISSNNTLFLNATNNIDVTGNRIINLGIPILNTDAVNKSYVDTKTFGNLSGHFSTGNLVFGNTSGSISETPLINFNGNTLNFTNANINLGNGIISNVTSPTLNTDVANKYYVDTKTSNFNFHFSIGNLVFGNTAGSLSETPLINFNGNTLNFTNANINLGNGIISNVTSPTLNTDVANKYYVDLKTSSLNGHFSTGNLLFGNTSGSITETPLINFNGNTLNFTNANISLGNGIITNVTLPTLNTDVANKYYVDTKTFGNISAHFSTGNFLFGNTSGSISETPLINFNGNTLNFTNANISLGNGIISNVTSPTLNTDVANKYYVDTHTIGNFVSGQIVIGTIGNALTSTSDFGYSTNGTLELNNLFVIKNTAPSLINSTYGSALTVLGGIDIKSGLDVNYKRITSVQYPINAFDAVNKQYIDTLFGVNNSDYLQISDQQIIPAQIPNLIFDPNLYKVFVVSIYTFANNEYSLYNIRGFLTNNGWILTTMSIDKKNTVNFSIDATGQFYYTNNSAFTFSFIRSRTLLIIDKTFTDYSLTPMNIFSDIGAPFIYLNSETLVEKVTIYVHASNNDYAVFYLTLLRKNNVWQCTDTIQSSGTFTGIKFTIRSDISAGYLQYINTRNTQAIINFTTSSIIPTNSVNIVLDPNTIDYKNIDSILLSFPLSAYAFYATFYVEIPSINKYATYDISVISVNSIWKLNSTFTGDNLSVYGIKFDMSTSDRVFIVYRNTGTELANLRYIVNTPNNTFGLKVENGGTGTNTFFPTSILRGNGTSPIIGDSKLTFDNNNVLTLSASSSILIKNNQDTINTSTGSFITYGGVNIGKSLIVNNINITPGKGDLTETIFMANNNTTDIITNFIFDLNVVKSFKSCVCISVMTNTGNTVQLLDLYGLNKNSMWFLYTIVNIGDNTGITFSINNSGQVFYSSVNIINWISTSISFNAKTIHNV